MKKYESKLSQGIEKAAKKHGIFTGQQMNSKNAKSTMFGPMQACYYVQDKANIEPEIKSFIYRRKNVNMNKVLTSNFVTTEATRQEVIRYCRVSNSMLNRIGFVEARKYTDSDNNFFIEIDTVNYGSIKLITFQCDESNVGVFMNGEGETSFVADGRCEIINDKVYLLSTNETALQSFWEEKVKNPESRISLNRIISKEIWQIKEDGNLDDIIKAVMWLGYTKYCEFPKYNGTYFNTIRSMDENNNLYDICNSNPDLKKYINFSSLSQTGISGVCGPLKRGLKQFNRPVKDKYGNDKLDKEGNPVTETLYLIEAGEVTPFAGMKGKLDVSANQGNKMYKQSNYQGRSLVLLAEIKPNGYEYAVNLSGNCIATKSAAEGYLTDMTRDKARECHMGIPAHKIFIRSNGQPIRIKGATHIMDMIATCPDGTVEDNIVILPPREYNTDGTIDTDYSKFEHLCAYRDDQSKLGLYELEYEDKKITVPGLYCHIYEDAMHSAVTSLKVDVQNIAYYGAVFLEYTLNGKSNLRKAMTKMIDHKKMLRAMNFAKIGRAQLEEQDYTDFINNL